MKDHNDMNSHLNLAIRIITCVLLLVICVLGGMIVNNNLMNNRNHATNTVVQTEAKSQPKEDKNVNITIEDKRDIVVVQPKEKVIIEKNRNDKVGKIYLADVYEYLSLRTSASTSAPVKANLSPCTEMTVLSDSYDPMVYVCVNTGSYAGYTGYVNENYITQKGYQLIRVNNNSNYGYYYVYNTKEYLPIRSYPEINDAYEIGRTYNGQKVLVIEKTNDKFWLVEDVNSGIVGYVVKSYLTR